MFFIFIFSVFFLPWLDHLFSFYFSFFLFFFFFFFMFLFVCLFFWLSVRTNGKSRIYSLSGTILRRDLVIFIFLFSLYLGLIIFFLYIFLFLYLFFFFFFFFHFALNLAKKSCFFTQKKHPSPQKMKFGMKN